MKLSHTPHLACMCVLACPQGSGREPRPLRCLWALYSSANHNGPFFRSSSLLPLKFSLFFPQPYLLGEEKKTEWDRSLILTYPKWTGSMKTKKEDLVQTRTCVHRYATPQTKRLLGLKESGCEACLLCAAGSDIINWGLFVCWVDMSVKVQHCDSGINPV